MRKTPARYSFASACGPSVVMARPARAVTHAAPATPARARRTAVARPRRPGLQWPVYARGPAPRSASRGRPGLTGTRDCCRSGARTSSLPPPTPARRGARGAAPASIRSDCVEPVARHRPQVRAAPARDRSAKEAAMTAPHDPLLLDGLTFGRSPLARWPAVALGLGHREIIAVDLRGRRESSPARRAPCCIDFLPDGRLLLVSGEEDSSCARGGRHARRSRRPATPRRHALERDRRRSLGSGNLYLNNIGFDFPPATRSVRGPGRAGRPGAPGGGRRRLPQQHGRHARRRHLDRRRVLRRSGPAFDIGAGGALSGRATWAHLGAGAPDGICLDAEGAIWYADVPNRRCVRVREGAPAGQRRPRPRLLLLRPGRPGRSYPVPGRQRVVRGRDRDRGRSARRSSARPHRAGPRPDRP